MSQSQAGHGLSTLYVPDPTEDFQVANRRFIQSLTAIKQTTQTKNSDTVLANDTELFVAMEANVIYGFTEYIRLNSVAAADILFDHAIPAGALGNRLLGILNDQVPIIDDDITDDLGANTDGTDQGIYMIGNVRMGATPGNLNFRWAQNASNAGDTSILAGSWMKLFRV